MKPAIEALSALAHPGRLAVFRLLVPAGEAGLQAGEIARAVGVLPNTMSAHLNVLSAAGLIVSRREGRSVYYAAAYDRMRGLLGYLIEDCCGGRPEICSPFTRSATGAGSC